MLAKIGAVEVWQVLESEGPLAPLTAFFPDLTEDALYERAARIIEAARAQTPTNEGLRSSVDLYHDGDLDGALRGLDSPTAVPRASMRWGQGKYS